MTPTDPPQSPETPTVASAPSPRRFLRSPDDRVLGGVAGGLGRAFGVDATIFRIALAALVFAGGVGLLAYAAALLFVPSDDGTGQPAPRERTWRTAAAVGGGILMLLAALALLGAGDGFWAGGWLVPAALVAGVGYAVLRLRGDEGRGAGRGPLVRLLTVAAVGLAVLLGAGLAFWGSAWATAAGGGVLVASAVLALGAALVAAAFRGDTRGRWLALPALIIAFPAAVVSAADVSLDGGVGDRTHHPAGADRLPAGYRLGAGELVVDLRDLDWRDGRRVALDLDVGVGHAVVLVPEAVCVGARSDIGAGQADVFGRGAGGVDVDHDVTREPAAGAPGLTLDVHMGMGAFEVLHHQTDDGRRYDRAGDRENGRDGDHETEYDERLAPGDRRTARQLADRACLGGRS